MVTTLVLVLASWALLVPAVLAFARLLGRLSTAQALPAAVVAAEPAAGDENVVPLVPRPQNRLDQAARRAA